MDKSKIIVLPLFFVSLTSFVKAQSFKKVMVANDIEMTANLNNVWTVISNLTNLDKLVPEIITRTEAVGNGEGPVITLTLKSNGLKVVEKVTKLDNEKHIITYEMLETPMLISDYKATIKIIPLKKMASRLALMLFLKFKKKTKKQWKRPLIIFKKHFYLILKKTYSYEQ